MSLATGIQTFWHDESDTAAGWISHRFACFSYALSACLLSRHFKETVLYTDNAGKQLLIDNLGLPYSKVELSLEGYEPIRKKAWALRKLFSYALQNSPFVHIDTDAYLFNPLPFECIKSPLFAQNIELDHPFYISGCSTVKDSFEYCPKFDSFDGVQTVSAVNAGIIGGRDTVFYKELYSEALRFVDRNGDQIERLSSLELNTYIEQYLFKQLADYKGISIFSLTPSVSYPEPYGLDKFHLLPNGIGYLHAMNYKMNPTICEQIAQRLWLENPELYERCHKVSQETKNPIVSVFVNENFMPEAVEIVNVEQKELSNTESMLSINDRLEMDVEDLMADKLQFEGRSAEFSSGLPQHIVMLEDREMQILKTNAVLQTEYYDTNLLDYGSFAIRIDSQWNWSEKNEFVGQAFPNTIEQNKDIPTAYYETLIFYSPFLNKVREYLLDPMDILIFDEIDPVNNSYGIIVNNVCQMIAAFNPESDQVRLRSVIDERMRFFLYLGVLKF